MKKGIFFLLVLGLMTLGCTSNNKAADNSSSAAQPAAGNSASSNSAGNTSSADSDKDFLMKAGQGNQAEITLGKMVAAKTTNPQVKQFAQMMVKDHTAALEQIKQVAQAKNVTIPEGLPEDAQQLQTKLQGEKGKQFDKTYMDGMVEDHKKDVAEFQDASQNAKDNDVKQLASTLTPKLQMHLDKAQQINQKLGGSPSSSSSSSSGSSGSNPGA
jgi:putative membrane protein